MGRYLNQMELTPDCLIVSGAQRTQQTARLLLNHLTVPENHIMVDKELYLADRETLQEIIEVYATDNKRLMIVAHNPGMDELVSYLASTPVPLSSNGKLMVTCAVACFRIDSVSAIKKPGQGELVELLRPKEIGND